ncbi:MAG: hypothetical protein QM581_05425, partial [Pseudomonas sp.]
MHGALAALALLAGAPPSARADVPPEPPPAPLFALCERWCALVDAQGHAVTPRVFDRLGDNGDPLRTRAIAY